MCEDQEQLLACPGWDVNIDALEWEPYLKVTVTRAVQMKVAFSVKTIEGNTACGQPGDYLCTNGEGDYWPCAQEAFEATYKKLEV